MAVNLLPHTPPQNHGDTHAARQADDAADDAPSFSQRLVAAAGTLMPKPTRTTSSPVDAPAANAPAKLSSKPAEQDLAALLATALAIMPIEPRAGGEASDAEVAARDVASDAARCVTPGEAMPAANVDEAPKGARGGAADALMADAAMAAAIPAPATLSGFLGDVVRTAEPGAAARTSVAARVAPLVVAGADPKHEARAAPQHAIPERARPDTPDAALKVSVAAAAAEAATDALRSSPQQKGVRTSDAASSLPTAELATVPSMPAASPIQLTVTTPAFTPAWRDELAQHLVQLVMVRQDRAEIHLHPADLGPISVQIRMEGGQANLLIQAPQAATRDGLELALPQLRDSLAQQGVTLGETSIGDERHGQRQWSADGGHADGGSASITTSAVTAEAPVRARRGLVDLFA